MRIAILGGGLTGLTLAANLTHPSFEVLEKETECGGLCRSLQRLGFIFDYGGAHIIFSRNAKPVDYMGGRFAEFEYLNLDACVERALKLAQESNRLC